MFRVPQGTWDHSDEGQDSSDHSAADAAFKAIKMRLIVFTEMVRKVPSLPFDYKGHYFSLSQVDCYTEQVGPKGEKQNTTFHNKTLKIG